ncbi:MAG: hypothetical protein ACYTGX_03735 [Planctomycetota bacterium]|jgi:hypothetical protein
MRGCRPGLLFSLIAALAAAAGCAAGPPTESVRLATAIAAERDGRFALVPHQESDGITVQVERPGAVPDNFAAQAAAVRRRFRALLGRSGTPAPPLTILVFETPRRLQVALGVSSGVHGLALTHRDAPTIVLAAGEGGAALQRHLRHEIAHVVSNVAEDAGLAPGRTAWVEEGLAYLLEWGDRDEPPRPSAALLQILAGRAPNPALVPHLMSTHYRPRGNAATMRRLAAGAATLVHFYWDRAARRGPVQVEALLRECAHRSPGELHEDAAAWTAHWRRLHRLARAHEAADVAARFLEAYVAGARVAGRHNDSTAVRPLAAAATTLAEAADRAAAPGADLPAQARRDARTALERLRSVRRRAEAADPKAEEDELHRMLLVAEQQLEAALAAAAESARRRRGGTAK